MYVHNLSEDHSLTMQANTFSLNSTPNSDISVYLSSHQGRGSQGFARDSSWSDYRYYQRPAQCYQLKG